MRVAVLKSLRLRSQMMTTSAGLRVGHCPRSARGSIRIQKTSRRADLSTRLQPDFDHVFESRNCINSANFFLTGNQPHGGVSQTLFTLGEMIPKKGSGGLPESFFDRTSHYFGNSLLSWGAAKRLFSDQFSLERCRRRHNHGPSTAEPLGNFHSSWAGFLDREQ
jgi:hypothetical protein